MKKQRVREEDMVSVVEGKVRLKMDEGHVAVGVVFENESIIVKTASKEEVNSIRNSTKHASDSFHSIMKDFQNYLSKKEKNDTSDYD